MYICTCRDDDELSLGMYVGGGGGVCGDVYGG